MLFPKIGIDPGLSYDAARAATYIKLNQALLQLDAIGQLSVIDRTHSSPPGGTVDGDMFIVASSPSGAWSTATVNQLALKYTGFGGTWYFFTPSEGFTAWVSSELVYYVFTSSAWAKLSGTSSVGMVVVSDPAGGSSIVNLTGRTASISAATLITPSSAGAYRASIYHVFSTAGTSGTLQTDILWNDGIAARTKTSVAPDISAGSTAYDQGDVFLYSAASQAIQYQTTLTTPTGPISTVASAPTAGGTGYTLNDVLNVTTGGTGGQVTATGVSGGIVTAVTLTTAGSGYSTGTGKATTGGTGTGCTVNITAIALAYDIRVRLERIG